jgi:two-component system LytT family response regulator
MMRALIADDEALARKRLRTLVAGVAWLECVGEAENGLEAVRIIDAVRPDLVFLDIQMPGLSGLQVLERISHEPAVIFTTAHNDYAVQAFELEALDYLLKPFGRERFLAAVERARALPAGKGGLRDRAQRAMAEPQRLTRLFVRHPSGILPLAVTDIERVEADDDYVAVIVKQRRHLLYMTMNELVLRLDPQRFIRVHRSHIVNLDHVARMVPHGDSRLEIQMRDGARIVASRSGSQALRGLLA